ncbi:MAG: hypothetical protein IBJ10_01865 [Phycisphaerales bacterium]|nr:hypothetical protein [Phycisphaerales bacterium]
MGALYDAVFGHKKWGKLIPSHMWSPAQGRFIKHPKADAHTTLKAVGIVGMTAGAMLSIYTLEHDRIEDRIALLFTQFRNASSETARLQIATDLQIEIMALTASLGVQGSMKAVADTAFLVALMDEFGYDGPPFDEVPP